MMRSLFSGVSGLKSHQTRMDVIGNNIANINTVGFKSSRVTFADMLSQTQTGASSPSDNLGGTNPKQIGLGTSVASVDLIFNDGSPQATGKNTDVALSGNGLFVLKSGNQTYFTRDGAFEFDAQGNYVLPGSGYYVQGWNAVDGALNTNSQPTNINVPAGKTMESSATDEIDFNGNLNASEKIIEKITYTLSDGTSDTLTTNSSDKGINIGGCKTPGNTSTTVISATIKYVGDSNTQTVKSGYYEVGHSVPITTISTVYDSEGNTHAVTMLLDKGDANKWRVYLAPDSDTGIVGSGGVPTTTHVVQPDSSTDTVTMKVGTVTFQTDGSLHTDTSTGNLSLKYNGYNGATDTVVTVTYSGLTQYAGSSTVYPTANGHAYGVLQSVAIDGTGVITGTYTNGVRRYEAQIAVAQFINASGLTKVGTSLYLESNNSGTANIKTVSNLGLSVTPAALEMSNVDLSNELSDMIITQRGFQSNSKIITVADEMLETIINMKR